jgi:hypothetical protein
MLGRGLLAAETDAARGQFARFWEAKPIARDRQSGMTCRQTNDKDETTFRFSIYPHITFPESAHAIAQGRTLRARDSLGRTQFSNGRWEDARSDLLPCRYAATVLRIRSR